MSNYSKTTDFEAKDSLPTGDSGKIIRGAEFETEFDAISTAIATKADTAGPTFTGTLTFETISDGTIGVTAFVDEDDMSSDSATLVPTQQSVKAYVDSQVTAQDLDFQADTGGALSIDLDSETMTFTGGTGIDTSGSGNAVTFAIDSTVATLTGTQTLTNKTLTAPTISGNLTTDGTIDGRDVATDGAKLDGIEAGATGDQTAAEIRTLVDSASDSNVFTDADHSKLDGIEAGATGDQTNAEIRAAVEAATDSNVFTDADHSKLDGIEASADVTDTANVTAAGALMDSELTSEASVKALNQGVATTDSPTFAAVTVNGNVEFDGLSGTGAVSVTDILDQDDMSSNSATALATQQSIKAYVDSQVATADTLAEVLANGNTTGGTDVAFGDNDKAIFGSGSDLQIYHDGSDSVIQDFGTGDLKLIANEFKLYEGNGTDLMIGATPNGAVTLSHDASTKLATTSTGIDVTGSVVSDGLTVDGTASFQAKVIFDNNDELRWKDSGGTERTALVLDGSNDLNLGTSAGGNLKFYNGSSYTERMRIDSSGNVGIGTSSPDTSLHISEPSTATATVRLEQTDTTLVADQAVGVIEFEQNDAAGAGVPAKFGAFGENANAAVGLRFYTGTGATANERMRIDSSGNVGVGTTTPSFVTGSGLEIQRTTATATLRLEYTGSNGYEISAEQTQVTYNSASSLPHVFEIGSAEKMRLDASGNLRVGVGNTFEPTIQFTNSGRVVGNPGYSFNGDLDTGMFNPSTQGTIAFSNNGSESMRIDASGNVGIGTSSPSSKLHVQGTSYFFDQSIFADKVGIGTSSPSTNLHVKNTGANAIIKVETAGGLDSRLILDAPSASGAQSQIFFDASGTTAGSIQYTHNSGGTNFMTFHTGGSNAERMRIDSSGNVGIGTSSPARQFHLHDSSASYLHLTNGTTGSTANDGASISMAGTSLQISNRENGVLQMYTNGSEAMRIDSAGNVGIGTSSPAYKLQVNGSSEVSSVISIGGVAQGNFYSDDTLTVLNAYQGNPLVFSVASSGTSYSERMRIDSSGNVGIGTSSIGTNDRLIVKTAVDNAVDQGLVIQRSANSDEGYINYNGGAFRIVATDGDPIRLGHVSSSDRVSIDASGNFLVGKTVADNGTTGITFFSVGIGSFVADGSRSGTFVRKSSDGGVIEFRRDASTVGSISVTTSATAYNTSSDQRLKDNIVDAPSASDDIDAIQVRSFDWKADGSHQKYGMVAQELQSVAPEAVSEGDTEEDMMGVDYSKLVPMLVKEIQSLRARVAQLEGEN